MSHHTNLHCPQSPHETHDSQQPANSLIWVFLLNVTTAVVALFVYRVMGLGLVAAILIGFVVAAVATSLIHEVWRHTR